MDFILHIIPFHLANMFFFTRISILRWLLMKKKKVLMGEKYVNEGDNLIRQATSYVQWYHHVDDFVKKLCDTLLRCFFFFLHYFLWSEFKDFCHKNPTKYNHLFLIWDYAWTQQYVRNKSYFGLKLMYQLYLNLTEIVKVLIGCLFTCVE